MKYFNNSITCPQSVCSSLISVCEIKHNGSDEVNCKEAKL